MINKLAENIHQDCIDKGYYKRKREVPELLCLIHSELSEALEADRKERHCTLHSAHLESISLAPKEQFNKAYKVFVKGTFDEEMADVFIRCLDLCAFYKIDIETHIKLKMLFNKYQEPSKDKKY